MTGDEHEDQLIQAIARNLREPVPLDPALRDRVMTAIARPGSQSRPRTWVWAGGALAAGMAALALLLVRTPGRPPGGVPFALEAPEASRVSVVGDFNNWDPLATPLRRTTATGRWEAILPLPPGRYQFTFVVDGTRWVADPALPHAIGEDFDQPTSVITIPPARS